MAGKKTGKRLLTWVLVLVMALSLLPLNALAEEADEADALQMSDEDNSGDRSLMPAKTTYTITFNANGGTFADGTVEYDGKYSSRDAAVRSQSPKDDPTRPPYVFKGWYKKLGTIKTDVDIKNDKVKNVLLLPTDTSRTLYAKWSLPDNLKVASIFYLKDPTKNRDSNTGEDWNGPLGGKEAGFVNIANLSSWEETKTWGDWRYVENCFTVSTTDVTWPTGFGTPNKDGLELNKGSTEWNAIFEAFKEKVEADNGGISLTKDDVDSITLVPYKVSRYNSTGGSYHVDCEVEIQCKEIFTVKFFFNNGTTTDQLKAMHCRQGNSINDGDIPTTNLAPDGYEFDGWYTSDTFDPNTKVTFPLMPNANVDLYARYKAIETPNPEPDDPKLGVNFKYEKNIVDVICETTDTHDDSYGLKNGYYTVSDKTQLANGNWQCKITINLAKYFELYNSWHSGHTRDMNHPYATATMWISPTWSASSGQWSCAESLIDAAKIYVKCDATPTEYIPVTLTANSKTVTYNGEEQTVTGYTSNAPEGVTFEGITATGSGTNAGEYTVKFSNGAVGKTDTTGKYIVAKTVDGKLTINKCPILITAKGFTTVYNGKSPVVEDYTILRLDSNGEYVNGLPTGHKIDSYVTYGSGVDAGEYERFSMDKAKIVDAKDKDVTSNYDIGYENRTLTINKRIVTLTSETASKPYDGTPLTKPEVTVGGDGFVEGEVTDIRATGSVTYVSEGEVTNTITYTKGANFKADNYTITEELGKLTITPVTDEVTVTITGNTKTVRYNGKEQTVEGYTVSIDNKLYTADDFTFSGNAKATGTDADTYYMGLKDEQFTNNNNNFKNVKFVVTDGTLTITKAPTYTFDLSNLNTIKVNKEFVSRYGRSATMSFEATATIEKKEAYIITDSGINTNASNSAAAAKSDYTKVVEAAGMVTLKTGTTDVFKFSGKYDLEPGDYRITVKEAKGSDRYYVTYDDTTYTYDFTVNDKGEISIKTPITCTFTNKYTKRHTTATPSKPTLNTGDHYAYVMGYPDGTVRPNGSITRAEVSAILFRLLSDKTRDEYFTTESSFTDVKAGAWYNNSIATLEKAGVIVDTAKGGAFRPNEAITRAELAAMLAQFSDAKPVKGVKFSDVSAKHWAYEAIAIAAKMGWIEGYPDGTFRPDATITRAEMMTLVNRALERVPSDEDHLLSKRVMLTFPDCKSGDWFYIAVQEATNSHTYERAATEKNGDEQWTALRANRDWTLLEK